MLGITLNFLLLAIFFTYMRGKNFWDFRISDLAKKKTLMEVIFNPCGEFRWSPVGPVSQIHSPHPHVGAPAIFSDLLSSVQMLKREWGAGSNEKLPHLFIPSKTAALVPEFCGGRPAFGRTVAYVPALAVKGLPLGRTLWWWWWCIYCLSGMFNIFKEHWLPMSFFYCIACFSHPALSLASEQTLKYRNRQA